MTVEPSVTDMVQWIRENEGTKNNFQGTAFAVLFICKF